MSKLLKDVVAQEVPGLVGGNIPGRIVSMDMTEREISNFAATGTSFRTHEHRYAWAYKPPYPFIYAQVAPPLPVSAIKTDYRLFAERTFFDRPDTTGVTRTSHPAKIRFTSSTANIDLTGRALAIELSDVDKADAIAQYGSSEVWRQTCISVLKTLIELDLEIEIAALFQTQGNFATGYYGTEEAGDFAATKYWSNAAATPLADCMMAVYGKTSTPAPLLGQWDSLIVGKDVNYYLRTAVSDVKSAVTVSVGNRSSARPIVDEEAVKQYFNIANYIVGGAMYNSTPESATPTMSDIWSKYAVMCQLSGALGGDMLSPAFARIAVLDSQVVPNYQGWTVRSVRDEMMGAIGGEILVVAYWAQPVIISQKLGWNLKVVSG